MAGAHPWSSSFCAVAETTVSAKAWFPTAGGQSARSCVKHSRSRNHNVLAFVEIKFFKSCERSAEPISADPAPMTHARLAWRTDRRWCQLMAGVLLRVQLTVLSVRGGSLLGRVESPSGPLAAIALILLESSLGKEPRHLDVLESISPSHVQVGRPILGRPGPDMTQLPSGTPKAERTALPPLGRAGAPAIPPWERALRPTSETEKRGQPGLQCEASAAGPPH